MKRLLLTLEPGPVDPAQLEPYVRLAAELGVELEALLVEDQDLRTVAGLPFCHEVIRDSARARPLNPDRLERATRQLSRELQQRLQQLARRHPVHWQLRVHRGHWFDGLGDSWAQTELLVLTRAAEPRYRLASAHPPKKPVALICDSDSVASHRALRLAARLAAVRRQGLLVLALPGSPWRRAADLPPLPVGIGEIRVEALQQTGVGSLQAWLPGLADTLVLSQEWLWPDNRPATHPLLELPGVQVLVVR